MKKTLPFIKAVFFLLIGFLLTSDKLDVAFAHPPVNEADAVWTGHQQVHPVGIFCFLHKFSGIVGNFSQAYFVFSKIQKAVINFLLQRNSFNLLVKQTESILVFWHQ